MPKKKTHFIGILSNTDNTILKVDLNHGFKIKDMSDTDGGEFISLLERISLLETYRKIIRLSCSNLNEKKIYFITNSFDCDIELDERGALKNLPSYVLKFDNNFKIGYLDPLIRLLRLFKEGNICMPLRYYYVIENNNPKSFIRESTELYISKEPIYTLENSEISDFYIFIKNIKLPFTEPFLQLAFENFELSYHTHNLNLSFLSLMISLESLFNPGGHELRYRISRNCAVLLGKDKEDSNMIFSDIKDLYEKRSKIVHKGEKNIINKQELYKLRYYVRESIKEINKIRKNKDKLIEMLNSCGFGEKPWTKFKS